MTILLHPLFPTLEPYFKVTKAKRDSENSRVRIEILPIPEPLLGQSLAAVMPCVRCGKSIHPFRARRAPNKRTNSGTVYFAAACPPPSGCSKGGAAQDEYQRIREHFNV